MPAASRSRPSRATFVGAVARPGQPPPGPLPQVAFAGRSNVGKSSLINAVLGRKRLARVSRTPGRTQQINFYRVDDRYLIADLPGYGFARVPAEIRRAWGPLVESYLGSASGLLGVVLLIDIRRGVQTDDRRLLDYLAERELPTLFVLTKADTLSTIRRRAAVRGVREALDVGEDQLLATSVRSGAGVASLAASVEALVREAEG